MKEFDSNDYRQLNFLVIREMMTRIFPDDEIRDGSRNIGLLAVQPPDVAISPRKFYRIQLQGKL